MSTDDFILITSISCPEKGDKVELNPFAVNGDTAVFLKNPVKQADKTYLATEIDYEEAARTIGNKTSNTPRIPLFVVHGYWTEPTNIIDDIAKSRSKFENSKYYPIFVLWPCSGLLSWEKGTITGYEKDSDLYSQNAGKAFFDFVKKIPDHAFPRKSLMMHSMGNHVVFDGACRHGAPQVQFENIFMVAADLPCDGFHNNPDEGYWFGSNKEIWGNKKEKADNFYEMLAKDANGKPKGKIVVLYNGTDKALFFSSNLFNGERRLGQRGMGTYRTMWSFPPGRIYYDPENYLPKKFQECHKNEDCNSWGGVYFGDAHGYQFHEKSIDIYDKYAL